MGAAVEEKKCPYCAETIRAEAKKCRYCGEFLDPELRQARQPNQPATARLQKPWNPGVAAVLSFLIPGLGQIYKGELTAGIAWLFGAIVVAVIGSWLLFIPSVVYAVVCMMDAHGDRRDATQDNAVQAPDDGKVMSGVEGRQPVRLSIGAYLIIMGGLLVVALLFSGWKYYSKNGLPNLRRVRAAALQTSPPAAKPPAPADASRTAASAAPAIDGFVVRVKAREESWISITVDGKQVVSAVLPKDSEKSVHARQSVALRLGKATGFDVFYNDKLLPPLIPDGKVKTMEFTSAGLRR